VGWRPKVEIKRSLAAVPVLGDEDPDCTNRAFRAALVVSTRSLGRCPAAEHSVVTQTSSLRDHARENLLGVSTLASTTRESNGASLKTGPLLVAESRSRAHASAADRPGHLRDVDEAMRVAFRVVRIDNEFAAFQVV
jgi:hypothetical protein